MDLYQDLGSRSPINDGDSLPASDIASDAKSKVEELAEPLTANVLAAAEQQKSVGADQIQVVARAVHGAAAQLEADMPQLASQVHNAGSWMDRTAADFRQKKLEDLARTFGTYARKEPAMMFGGAILTGLAFSRFLKSSNPGQQANRPSPVDSGQK